MKTAMAWIKGRLTKKGYVTNFECIDKRITTRLGAAICELRKKGWIIEGDFIKGTKNYKYTFKGFDATKEALNDDKLKK